MQHDQWLTIGELARRTGLTTRTLRHYDQLGLLVASGRGSGEVRQYGPDDVRRLLAIQHLKSLGLSLQDVASALDDPGFDAAAAVDDHIALVESRIAAEHDLLERLRRLRSAADTGWDEVVEVIALTERLRHPDAAVRVAAALSAPAEAPLAELVDLLRADPAPGVREVATWAVSHHGAAAVEAVVAHLDDPDPAVRLQMAHVASKLRDPAACPALVGLLDDPEPAVRAKAAFALGQIGDPAAVPGLVAALVDPSTWVADALVDALGRFGRAAPAPLEKALTSGDDLVRERAAEALGHLGAATAVPALARALADPSAELRMAALLALGAIDDDAARTEVVRAARHADERLAAVARRLANG